jgi:Icc-related predicted phosphoesterase
VGGRPLPAAVLGGAQAAAIRVVATSDLHCDGGEESRERLRANVAEMGDADLVLVAGDLTADGRAAQAAPVAEELSQVGVPVVAVLGNHDERVEPDTLTAVLEEAGVVVLRCGWRAFELGGTSVGVVGTTGCIGGFDGRGVHGLTRRGRQTLRRRIRTECTALDRGLAETAGCAVRIVLLHYSPTAETLHGEPPHLVPLLGCHELAVPIAAHGPDLVIHGHAHHGSFEGHVGSAPVFNVSDAPHGFTVRAAAA